MPDPNKNQDNFIPVAPRYSDGPVLIQFPSRKLPIFWGPGQLLDDNNLQYVVPTGWHELESLKIPRVGRLIYGGKFETETEDYSPANPASPPPPPPPDVITCAWTYTFTNESRQYFFKKESFDAGFRISFYSEGSPPLFTSAIATPAAGQDKFAGFSYDALQTWQNAVIGVIDSGGNQVFFGNVPACPHVWYGSARQIGWVFKCSRNPNLILDTFIISRSAIQVAVSTAAPRCWVPRTDGSYYSEVPIQNHEAYGCGPYPGG